MSDSTSIYLVTYYLHIGHFPWLKDLILSAQYSQMQKCLQGSKIVLFGMQKQITHGELGSDSSAS